jgi:beta-glucosidase
VKTVLDTGKSAEIKFDVSETIKITHDKYTGQVVKNLFTGEDAIDAMSIDGKTADYDPGIPFLTREGFMSLEDIWTSHVARAVTPGANFNPHDQAYIQGWVDEWSKATVDAFGNPVENGNVIWGANNGLKLYENGIITELGKKLGEDYNAEEWQALLDQLTIDECVELINFYYTATDAIDSIGMVATNDYDGPAQIKGFTDSTPRGTGYPGMTVLAASWNQELAYKFGQSFGDDMKSVGVNGLWGWAIDTHRTAFFSRNHESPSEDSILAGYTVMNAVQGLNTRGRYCFLKHFAVYDCGQNSDLRGQRQTSYWLTEQSLREVQLRAFYKPFVNGGALGAMTTYRGIGAEASETTEALIGGVLRGEWQFKGAITTDYTSFNTASETLLRIGGNLAMGNQLIVAYKSTEDPRFQNRLKEAMHEVIYMWLRADYNERDYKAKIESGEIKEDVLSSTSVNSWQWWRPAIKAINVFAIVTLSTWGLFTVINLVDPRRRF